LLRLELVIQQVTAAFRIFCVVTLEFRNPIQLLISWSHEMLHRPLLLNELSYAPEIAAAMLQRQQAEALVDARTLIVQGAVEIAKNAADQLLESGIEMAPAEKSRMVSNLICVICGDAHVQPTMQV